MIGIKKLTIDGNKILLPEGGGKDKVVLEKALILLRGIFANKMGKKLDKSIERSK